MNDMSSTIIARSDQINAADLIGTTRTVTVKEVRIKAGDDQPVTIMIEGDKKAFRPCKGVRRLLVRVWGADASKYIGHSMELFCDESVTWAGKEEGGIRVKAMTGLDEQIIEYMRVSKAATKPYKILPLQIDQRTEAKPKITPAKWAERFIAQLKAAVDVDALESRWARNAEQYGKLTPDLAAQCLDALDARRADFGRSDAEHGEGFVEQAD